MGLLSRFKHSSSPASSSKQSQPIDDDKPTPPSKGNGRPTTPTSKTHRSPNPNLDTPSSSKLVRPSIPTPSPSSNSITSKLAKPFKKQKGKEKEKQQEDPIKGTPYESHSHSHLPTPTRPHQSRNVSAPNSPLNSNRKLPINKQRRSTLLSFDPPLPPQPSSPLATTNPLSASTSSAVHLPSSSQEDKYEGEQEEHILDHNLEYDIASSSRRKDRVTSGQFRQVGGILGQLNFEVDLKSDTPRQSPPEKWLRRSSNPPVPVPTIVSSGNRNEVQDDIDPVGMTPSMTDESIVIIDKDDVHPDITQDTSLDYSSTNSPMEHEDEENRMELLESAEKKNKFWKRQRRSSKTQVDSEVERSHSPTPRRNSRNDTSLDLTNNRPSFDANQPEPQPRQPRPQQLRRPSSSFFHNPFTRSVSRTSLALDDNPKPDDGSFQLRGFRHVSGMMEVEGAGELENYLAHVRKEPRSSISSGDLLTSPIMGNNEIPSPSALISTSGGIPSPPVSYAGTPRQPPTFPLSRPASIANSLGSATGDEFISATKVSVAAFRKGIRRPSETLVTMSDSGHGVPTSRHVSGQHSHLHRDIGDDDDDDDLPLGMIRGKDMRRENSSQSLSSMRGTGTPSGAVGGRPATMFDQINRKTSPAPASSAIAANATKEGSASPAILQRQLSSEVVDRKKTPSPFAVDKKLSPSPSPIPSSSDITRRGSPALGKAQDIPRRPSPNPGLSFTVHRQRQGGGHTRNGGGSGGSGFVVKSTRLTRDDLLPKHGTSPATSGPSTPNPQQSESADATTTSEDFVTSPEELDPIDGYFSHLAPLIHDHSAVAAASLPRQPSPSLAPGPPVAPLPLPQVDDATPKSLNLPLPPDQMPDTPPKPPSDLPQTHTSPRAENRKKLSLLEEPMKIISGLWTSAPTDDGFDPAFVLSSMDAYGGDEQQSLGREMGHHPNPHPPSANVRPTTSGSDGEERIRSPLSERLAGIASSTSTNNLPKPSLSQIKTQDDGYASEKVRSPMSDSTISPATTVPPPHSASAEKGPTRPVPPKEIVKSSFARARKPSNKFEDTDESDEESEDESGTVESSGTTPQSRTKVQVGAGKRNSVERKVPHGPRKPSVNNRNRDGNRKRVSSMFDTSTTASNRPVNETDDRSLGVARKTIGKSPSVSNMPRSTSALGILGGTDNRRDIGVVGQRPKTLMELGPIVQPLKDRSGNHPTSPVTATSSRLNITSTDPRSSSSGNGRTSQQRQYSSNGNDERKKPTSAIERSPAQTLIKLPPDVEEKRKTASPDSSRSATTGGSVNYQPLTPKESEGRRLGREVMPGKPGIGAGTGVGGSKQLTYPDSSSQGDTISHSKNAVTHNRQRSYSSMGQNQPQFQTNQSNMNMNMGYDQNQMGMMGKMPQMSMGMGMQGMDPEAIRNMMKQQWQMQFMAAAYRASEEEWERASCVSGQTNQTVPASFGQASGGYGQQPFAPMQQMGWMGQYPNPMGMGGYGYPQGMFPNPNQPFGYPMTPQSPGPGFGSSSHSQGGIYSYGTSGGGAQSVFGGEFGPPPITPSQRFMNNSHQYQQAPPPLPPNSQQEIARNTRGRHNSSNQSQSVYIPSNLSSGVNASPTLPPPSSWGRRTGSRDWSDLPSQGQRGKARPQTQFIN
ncbi:hypothetical protein I302_107685 [Kwoniella bestiolae CBS 10118]|uniref:Uncharacterized protein n=1 Tax=Kwoniella bestiolae CBS 10118 TaxID=1296100 RepID=A0A1B9FXT7_9TREE|nr:hypothetical protein I302_06576 [Kwoniella bestiolae CBS 10118]OCF23593.1 hypothetical protein I302_06576 [Kwoniella bestiolae CBS 10118]